MPSKFNLDDQLEPTYQYEYRGLTFTLKTVPNHSDWARRQSELFIKFGIIVDQDKRPDIDLMDQEDKDNMTRVAGAAMIGTFVMDVEPFEVNGVEFKFNGPSDIPEYASMGEELIGENEIMQNHIFRHCLGKSNNLPDYEVVALKKSSTVSDSGGNQPQTVSSSPQIESIG